MGFEKPSMVNQTGSNRRAITYMDMIFSTMLDDNYSWVLFLLYCKVVSLDGLICIITYLEINPLSQWGSWSLEQSWENQIYLTLSTQRVSHWGFWTDSLRSYMMALILRSVHHGGHLQPTYVDGCPCVHYYTTWMNKTGCQFLFLSLSDNHTHMIQPLNVIHKVWLPYPALTTRPGPATITSVCLLTNLPYPQFILEKINPN